MDFGALPPDINSGRMFRARLRVDAGGRSSLGRAGRRPAFYGGLLSVGDFRPDQRNMAGSRSGGDDGRRALRGVADDDCCAVRAGRRPGQGRRSCLRGCVCDDGAPTECLQPTARS